MIELDTVLVNTILSIVVAVGVGLYIRYKVKPRHEIVFEHNRDIEFQRIFSTIHFLDFHFGIFCEDLEREMGPIKKEQDSLTPKPRVRNLPDGGQLIEYSAEQTKIKMKFDKLIPRLQNNYEHIKNNGEIIRKDYARLLSHIEHSFLKDILDYVFDTSYYAEWAQRDYLMNDLRFKRMKLAKKIIKFLQKDKSINIKEGYIKEFIDKWNKEFEEHENLI